MPFYHPSALLTPLQAVSTRLTKVLIASERLSTVSIGNVRTIAGSSRSDVYLRAEHHSCQRIRNEKLGIKTRGSRVGVSNDDALGVGQGVNIMKGTPKGGGAREALRLTAILRAERGSCQTE